MKRLLIVALIQLVFFGAVKAQQGNSYVTNFPATENPISEGGRWINGATVGLDWKNVNTIAGLAYGADASGTPSYNDPTALLTGGWGPNQTAQATVHSVNQTNAANQEVEFRLRSTLSAHTNSGYEINFRCTRDGSQYTEIVRWNGPLGSFSYVARASGPGIRDGDVVKATIVGNVITGYINNVQVVQGTDGTFTSGNPGIGFYMNRSPNANRDYGFTTFSVSDTGSVAPQAPSNLRIISWNESDAPTAGPFGRGVSSALARLVPGLAVKAS